MPCSQTTTIAIEGHALQRTQAANKAPKIQNQISNKTQEENLLRKFMK